MDKLIALAAIGLAAAYWWCAQKTRETVLAAAKARCGYLDVQFLDDSVAQLRMGLTRGPGGSVQLWRTYMFEFATTGEERYQGHVLIVGGRVKRIEMDAHRWPDDASAP